jgi:hypothetical protein
MDKARSAFTNYDPDVTSDPDDPDPVWKPRASSNGMPAPPVMAPPAAPVTQPGELPSGPTSVSAEIPQITPWNRGGPLMTITY